MYMIVVLTFFLTAVGFAVTFGAWVAEAAARRFRFTPVMNYGILISFLTGVSLAAPWPAEEVNYPKVGVKLVILVAIGALLGIGSARQRRSGDPVARPLFASVGVLALAAAAIGVLW